MSSTAGGRPFEGIRVIDATHVLAGPFAAYQLALLGADVIKVEHPGEPDQSRGTGPDRALNRAGMGVYALTQNANKRAVTLDLKQDGGREVMRRTADMLVRGVAWQLPITRHTGNSCNAASCNRQFSLLALHDARQNGVHIRATYLIVTFQGAQQVSVC